jgi:CubicO group peptidase (beta-lactamase class C family)
MKLTSSCLLLIAVAAPWWSAAAESPPARNYVAARFTGATRLQQIEPLLPEIDRLYADFAAERRVPGMAWGIVLDGRLIHTGAFGFANREKKIAAAADTLFRIASMSKSFTALAVMKLRDAGKLSLDDRVEKYLPDFARITPPTADSPPITLRNLLGMTAGFPEDNPWGDRQLAVTPDDFRTFLRGGLSFSNAPGVTWEYSNLAFALLGQIVARVAGEPYERYITREILTPLGMTHTGWEFADVPADKLALGYRPVENGWQLEPMLHDGVYGAMGGLLTTIDDFARYVAFHLDAWPPRDDPDDGPVARATRREMHRPLAIIGVNAAARNLAGEIVPAVRGYGFGLVSTTDSKGVSCVAHSGGLPGFGSEYRFFPDYGVGLIAFANATYASPASANEKAGAIIIEKGKLAPRTLPVSRRLEERKQQLVELLTTWDPKLGEAILAENFFLDRTRDDWSKLAHDTLARAGAIKSVGEIAPQNQLRGTFSLEGERGRVEVFFTLTPENPPRVQALRLRFVPR